MMRSILNASADLAIAPETHFVNRWLSRCRDLDPAEPDAFDEFWRAFSTSDHFAKLHLDADEVGHSLRRTGVASWRDVHVGLLNAFASSQGKRRLGEKVPAYFRHLDRLLEWYPDARIIYSVRDPRGVVASHRMLDEPWARVSDFELIRKWRDRAVTAVQWSGHPQMKIVRYEDLIADQRGTVASLCRFVDIAVEDAMLSRPLAVGGGAGAPLEPTGAVATTQVGAWRERLSPAQADVVAYATRFEARALGYDSISKVSVTTRLRFTANVVAWAAHALSRRMRRSRHKGFSSPAVR